MVCFPARLGCVFLSVLACSFRFLPQQSFGVDGLYAEYPVTVRRLRVWCMQCENNGDDDDDNNNNYSEELSPPHSATGTKTVTTT